MVRVNVDNWGKKTDVGFFYSETGLGINFVSLNWLPRSICSFSLKSIYPPPSENKFLVI